MPRSPENNEMTEEFRKNFAAYIKRERKKRKLTQKGFGALVGVIDHYIYNLEKGKHLPSRHMAYQIGEALDQPQTALITAGYVPFVGWPCV